VINYYRSIIDSFAFLVFRSLTSAPDPDPGFTIVHYKTVLAATGKNIHIRSKRFPQNYFRYGWYAKTIFVAVFYCKPFALLSPDQLYVKPLKVTLQE